MANPIHEKNRPCCKLLREFAAQKDLLKEPQAVEKLLKTLQQSCVVMQLKGQKRTKVDFDKSTCYMDINPETAQGLIDEAGKTMAVNPEMDSFYDFLVHANHALASNAKLGQISDRMQMYLAEMREGEKRFGRVPETNLLKDNQNTMGLSAQDSLKSHPLLADKPQFDGIAPKSNPNPVQNPEATENAKKLENQLVHQLTPKPSAAPKYTPR